MLAEEEEEVEMMSPWSNLPNLIRKAKIQAWKNGPGKKKTT